MLKWVEVNLKNIAYNIKYIRRKVGKKTKIIAVVKADAYGHGAAEVSRVLLKNGADMLAVANIYEAAELRQANINVPILLLNYTEPKFFTDLLKNKLTQTIFDLNTAQQLSRLAAKSRIAATVHIKIDTGMGRLGVLAQDAIEFIKKVNRLPYLKIEGIFSHLSSAGEDISYTKKQFGKFRAVLQGLEKEKIDIPLKHISNSIASLNFRNMHLNAVRPGIILYGISPWGIKKKCKGLKPVMSFKAKIVSLKKIPKGSGISYGRTYITKKQTLIADIPVGYAHGYDRNLSNKAFVLVRGKRAPLVGRVCMDQSLINVNNIKGVKPGDEVILFGSQGRQEITAEELASWFGSIGYEIVTTIGRLVPRAYKR